MKPEVSRFWHSMERFLMVPLKTKNPLPVTGKGTTNYLNKDLSTARSATGSGAAAAASAKGIGGGDGESRAVSRVHKINFDAAAFFQEALLHYKLQAAFFEYLIAFFWLIQSQTKRGTASATLHQGDANRRTDLVLLKICFQIIYC